MRLSPETIAADQKPEAVIRIRAAPATIAIFQRSKRNMKNREYLILIFCLTLSACSVTTTRFTSESEANVRSVGIDQNIKVPERAVFLGPTDLTDTMYAPSDWRRPDYALEERKRITREKFRVLIAEAEVARKGGIDKYMKNNQIDIGDIVLQGFEKQVRQHPKFVDKEFTSDVNNVDAKFAVEVRMFGLYQNDGLSDRYRPVLGVWARLVSREGKKLWERYDSVLYPSGGIPTHTLDEYFGDPRNMREAFQKISERVISGLMEGL